MPFHINPRTGNIRECKANRKPCPYGSEFHRETREETQQHRDELLAATARPPGSLDEFLRPGASSDQGFMGVFENYDDVVAADAETLTAYGTDAATVGAVLDKFAEVNLLHTTRADELRKGLRPEGLPDDVLVQVLPNISFRGSQDCPFRHHGGVAACNMALSGATVRFESPRGSLETNQLMGHLIREHGFFQGVHSDFRLEPSVLAEVLGYTRNS